MWSVCVGSIICEGLGASVVGLFVWVIGAHGVVHLGVAGSVGLRSGRELVRTCSVWHGLWFGFPLGVGVWFCVWASSCVGCRL